MKTYLGIDLGGTNVRVAKVTRDGIVLAEVKRPSLAQMCIRDSRQPGRAASPWTVIKIIGS